ncbi:MAG: FAD-dependent oxidoreductase [Myxococcota bacterium]
MRVVIIGNGVAGMEAALEVRRREPAWEITIISEESDHFFSRTALMWVFAGQLSHQCIEPLERDVYARLNFRRVRARAVGIDVEARQVRIAGGHDAVPFDRLLIASGSKPRPGPWPGSELAGIGHFVTHQDLSWYEAEVHGGPSRGGPPPNADAHLAFSTPDSPYAKRPVAAETRGRPAKDVAVIGGGLIGIEAVEVAHAAGLHPRFFIREEWFWPMAIDRTESTWISDRMREHGVHVHLEENVERFEGEGVVERIVTDQGDYAADAVVVAIGVVPNTDFLRSGDGEGDGDAPVTLDRSGGIVVDERLETSVPGVFAAGDCASVRWFNGAVRPEQLWYTARDQGRIAARGLLGDTVQSYARGHWYNSAKLMDIEYTTAGLVNFHVEGERNWFFEETGAVRSTNRIVLSGDRVVGFNFLGRRWDHSVLLRFIDEHRSLSYVLDHLDDARFDTEFVPPLRVPMEARLRGLSEGPAPSALPQPVAPPAV